MGGESLISSLFACSSIPPTVLDMKNKINGTFEILQHIVTAANSSNTTQSATTVGGVTYDKDMFHFLILSLQMIKQSVQVGGIIDDIDKLGLQTQVREILAAIATQSAVGQTTVVHPLVVDELRNIQSLL